MTSWCQALFLSPNHRDRASKMVPLGGTDETQLTLAFCDGKTLGLAFAIVENHKSAIPTVALYIDPGGQPKYSGVTPIGVGAFLISGHARNARRIVPAKTSADPDRMGVGRVSTKQSITVFLGSVERLVLSARK